MMAAMQELDPALIEELMNSALPEEEKQALKQQAMAQQLSQKALTYNPNMGQGSAAGGAMGAMAQGLAGYGSGSMQKASEAAMKDIALRGGQQRQKYFDARFPQPVKPEVDEGWNGGY